jgi:hypothetical protein
VAWRNRHILVRRFMNGAACDNLARRAVIFLTNHRRPME